MLIRNLNCETKSSQQQAQYLKRCKENISRTAGAPHIYGWDKRSWKVELGSQQAKCRRSRRWKVQKWWTTQRLPFKVSSAHHTFMKTLLNLQGSTLGLCILLGSPQCVVIFFDGGFALTSECVVATSYTRRLTVNQLERITEPLPGLQLMRNFDEGHQRLFQC